MVDAYGISVIRHRVGIGLLLPQPQPCVRSLQIPDLLAAFPFEFEYATPAETPQKRGVEGFAPLHVAHDEVEMMDPTRLHMAMLRPRYGRNSVQIQFKGLNPPASSCTRNEPSALNMRSRTAS